MDNIPRAQVSESDGEISCSVEETNRIRIALGLRPLDLGPVQSNATFVNLREQQEEREQQAEVAARIERARREREQAQASRAKSLGESLLAKPLSAAEWVALSRKKETVDQAKQHAAKQRVTAMAADEEEDGRPTGRPTRGAVGAKRPRPGSTGAAAGSELAGMRIRHDADTFKEGENVILTLADSNLLDEEGKDLAEDDDELVNSDAVDRERQAELLERKRKSKIPIYSGVDASEFDPSGAQSKRGVLSQYDDEEKKRGSLIVNADGTVVDTAAEARSQAIAEAEAAGHHRIDLGSGTYLDGQPKVSSDFYTKAEIMAIAKPKKKKKLRKAGAEDDEPQDGVAAGAGASTGAASGPWADSSAAAADEIHMSESDKLIADIRRQKGLSAEAGGADRGSRAARRAEGVNRLADDDVAAQASSSRAFDAAVAKATQKTAAILGRGTAGDAGAGGAAAGPAEGWESVGGAGADDAGVTVPVPSASSATSATSSSNNVSAVSKQRIYARLRTNNGDGDGEAEDDDAELQAALARARRLTRANEIAASASAAAAAGGAASKGWRSEVEPSRQTAAASASAAATGVSRVIDSDRSGFIGNGAVKEDPAARVQAMLSAYQRPGDVDMTSSAAAGEAAPGAGSEAEGNGVVFSDVTQFSGLLLTQLLDRQAAAAGRVDESLYKPEAGAGAGSAVPGVVAAQPIEADGGGGAGDAEPKPKPRKQKRAGAAAGGGGGSWKDVYGAENGDEEMGDAGGDGDDGEMDEDDGAGGGDSQDEGDEDEDGDQDGGGSGYGSEGSREEESATAAEHAYGNKNKGLAAALSMFARSGAFEVKEEYAGRTKDQRPEWDGGKDDPARNIKLEYKDEYGRKLTPKEAYRQLSYKFHGKLPSKSVRDKRLRKMLQEQKVKKASSGENVLGTGSMAALQKAQQARGQAFITLSKR